MALIATNEEIATSQVWPLIPTDGHGLFLCFAKKGLPRMALIATNEGFVYTYTKIIRENLCNS